MLLIPCLAGRAHLLARMGRHDEAAQTSSSWSSRVDRLDVDSYRAMAWHDEGLVALAAGRCAEAARLLGRALDAGAEISRPAARLARAEALARDGRPDEAATELRAALTEPTGRADQPLSLVPRVARVQGLVALARGDRDLARRRLQEAADGWERLRHDRRRHHRGATSVRWSTSAGRRSSGWSTRVGAAPGAGRARPAGRPARPGAAAEPKRRR